MKTPLLFTVAFRIAVISSIVLCVITSLWATITYGYATALPYTFTGSAITFVVVYIAGRLIISRRLTLVLNDLDNLANKRFFDREIHNVTQKDEIDTILLRLSDTSDTIEREIQRLKRMENYRKEFIGDVSHELKTPIFAIQGFIETLLDGALEDPTVNRDFLQKAMRNVNRLIHLTNDLMEIAKLETGELKTTLLEVPLRAMILEVVENLQYKAKPDQIFIDVRDIDASTMVLADRNQMRQVFVNLIENAIKYNKPGGTVKIGIRQAPNITKKITVYVQDTGVGIESKHLGRVTERFYRIDKSRSRDKGGTGLGLAIVKHILEAHNEQMSIESIPNEGTTITFTLQNASMVSG